MLQCHKCLFGLKWPKKLLYIYRGLINQEAMASVVYILINTSNSPGVNTTVGINVVRHDDEPICYKVRVKIMQSMTLGCLWLLPV